MKLILQRFAYAPDGTFGRIFLPNNKVLFTCERPWLGNKNDVSCIPDGIYTLKKRRSGVVERASGGDYVEGWEVTNVPGRTFIMLHPANWPHELEGCISQGKNYKVLNGKNGVKDSRAAFAVLMGALDGQESWELDIRPFRMEYP